MKRALLAILVACPGLLAPVGMVRAEPPPRFEVSWGVTGDISQDIVVDSAGNCYLPDMFLDHVYKYSPSGTLLATWGHTGTGHGDFSAPDGIGIDASDRIYVADTGNARVQVFTAQGAFIRDFGTWGSGPGQLLWPHDVDVDSGGNTYVADPGNHKIQKYDAAGSYIRSWTTPAGYSLWDPWGVALGSDGAVYVSDTYNARVWKFDAAGPLLLAWGTEGRDPGQFLYPYHLDVTPTDEVYVADTENGRVQKFTGNGMFLSQCACGAWGVCVDALRNRLFAVDGDAVWRFATVPTSWSPAEDPPLLAAGWGLWGAAPGLFSSPAGIAASDSGEVFVADTGNDRVQVFDGSGRFLAAWGSSGSGVGQFEAPGDVAVRDVEGIQMVHIADTGNHRVEVLTGAGLYQRDWGGLGSAPGQFNMPAGIALDDSGFVYVADKNNHRIQRFNSQGDLVKMWGSLGSGLGQLRFPGDVAVAADGRILVSDTGNDRIEVFDKEGHVLWWFGGSGSAPGAFSSPVGVLGAADGSIYVADTGNDRVQKFDANGWFRCTWGTDGTGPNLFAWVKGLGQGPDGMVYALDGSAASVQGFAATTPTVANPPPFVLSWGIAGTGQSEFTGPWSAATDTAGNVYVVDGGNHRVQKFRSDGTWVLGWGELGNGPGQFQDPYGIAVDSLDNVYVSELGNDRIQKFTTEGFYQIAWGQAGLADGDFLDPRGLTTDAAGQVYVADSGNNRIQKFTPGGTHIATWTGNLPLAPTFNRPMDVAAGRTAVGQECIYVADTYNHRVHVMTTAGADLGNLGQPGSWNGSHYLPMGLAVGRLGRVSVVETGNNRVQFFTNDNEFHSVLTTTGQPGGDLLGIVDVAEHDGCTYVVSWTQNKVIRFGGGASAVPYEGDMPWAHRLEGVRPNPFNPQTTIEFSLLQPQRVRLAIFDLAGRLVRVLCDEARMAGSHEVRWDGMNDLGRQMASGVYFCRMEAGSYREAKALTLVK